MVLLACSIKCEIKLSLCQGGEEERLTGSCAITEEFIIPGLAW